MDKPSKCVYKCHLVATRDLGKLYSVETKRINEAVKNNLDKFSERFNWKLTDLECKIFLVEKNGQKIVTRGGKYKNLKLRHLYVSYNYIYNKTKMIY